MNPHTRSGGRWMASVVRYAALCLSLSAATAAAQNTLPLKHVAAPTKPAITPEDLMTRLYLYADDSMMGREAGTEWNLKATAYIAAQVQRMGLKPAGDSGGYFQNVPLVKRPLDATATVSRSEEHTSELQSLRHLVCRLL